MPIVIERMSIELHFNGQRTDAATGLSLFDCADMLGIKVPTSCNKNGKCRECLVEIAGGMELLSSKTPEEKSSQGKFPALVPLQGHFRLRHRPLPHAAARRNAD